MAQSENYNESNTGKKSLSDEEVNGGIKGKLLSIGEDKNIHVEEEVGSSKPKDKIEGIVESRNAPCLYARQNSACSTEPRKENDDANRNRNNMVVSQASLGHLSHTPQESIDDAKSGKINTPTSYLSRDALTLAQLYQSSRRSRHSPHQRPGNSVIIAPKMVPRLPLTLSVTLDSQEIFHEMAHEEAWSFNIASPICNSCSSNSVSSMESEEFMTHEVVTANELFGEEDNIGRERKRRKITPGK